MEIVTSLSPNHSCKDNQINAIESWRQYGECFSLNHLNEIPRLTYDIQFVPVGRTIEPLFGKPLIPINAILDFAHQRDSDLLYVNSDIILKDLPAFKQDGITILSRYDYMEDMDEATLFGAGYDAFYIPKHLLHIFPPSIYALGAAWHDYWVPMWCIRKGIPVYYPNGRFAFHKIHPVQYSQTEWVRIGEYFRWEFNLDKSLSIPQIATNTLQQIRRSCRQ